MRSLAVPLAVALLLASAAPAHAEGLNNLRAGVNSLITFPADPVMGVVSPPELIEDMPGFPVTGRVVGLFGGTLMGLYRAAGGVYDLVFFPFWIIPTLSPPPRYEVIPGIEY